MESLSSPIVVHTRVPTTKLVVAVVVVARKKIKNLILHKSELHRADVTWYFPLARVTDVVLLWQDDSMHHNVRKKKNPSTTWERRTLHYIPLVFVYPSFSMKLPLRIHHHPLMESIDMHLLLFAHPQINFWDFTMCILEMRLFQFTRGTFSWYCSY